MFEFEFRLYFLSNYKLYEFLKVRWFLRVERVRKTIPKLFQLIENTLCDKPGEIYTFFLFLKILSGFWKKHRFETELQFSFRTSKYCGAFQYLFFYCIGLMTRDTRVKLNSSGVQEVITDESKCNRCRYFSRRQPAAVTNKRRSEGLSDHLLHHHLHPPLATVHSKVSLQYYVLLSAMYTVIHAPSLPRSVRACPRVSTDHEHIFPLLPLSLQQSKTQLAKYV